MQPVRARDPGTDHQPRSLIMDGRPSDPLERPDQIRTPDSQERQDGRPTGTDDGALKPGISQPEAPTVAPEEEGSTPTTEHAPGADL